MLSQSDSQGNQAMVNARLLLHLLSTPIFIDPATAASLQPDRMMPQRFLSVRQNWRHKSHNVASDFPSLFKQRML
jgi:hypothetical protein